MRRGYTTLFASGSRKSLVKQSKYFRGARSHQRGIGARLDVQPQQRFGVGGTQIEPPVGKLHAQAVEVGNFDGTRRVMPLDLTQRGLVVRDLAVDLTTHRKQPH